MYARVNERGRALLDALSSSGAVERVVERRCAVGEGVEILRARERGAWLVAHFGEDQHRALRPALAGELLEGVDAGGVDGGDVAHAQDEHARRLFDFADHFADLVRRAEEKGAVDLVDLDAFRNDAA